MSGEVEVLSKEAWLKARMSHITATEISAILGMNPWASKLTVWLQKTGRAEPVAETLPMRLGKMLQPVVLDLYDSETGLSTRRCGDTELVVCPDFPLAAATPDAEVPGDRIVEAKTASGRGAMKFGEVGSENAIPDYYAIQVYWQCLVMKQDNADLAALLSGRDFRIFPVVRGRNTELEAQLMEAAERFWFDYVAPDRMPPVDASQEAANFLARMYPQHSKGLLLPASDEAEQIKEELLRAKDAMDVAEVQMELAKNQLKDLIKEAEGIEFEDKSRAKWTTTKPSEKVDWPAIAAQVGSKISRPEYLSIVAKHTKIVPGQRRFYLPKTS